VISWIEFTKMYSSTTFILPVSSPNRDAVASDDQLSPILYDRRKPELKRRILAAIPIYSELSVRKRIWGLWSPYSSDYEHKLDNVVRAPK
jgi:hypothetical protein